MTKQAKNLSIIDKGLVVGGDMETKGRLIIKGSLNGTLKGEDVTIANEGNVNATVEVLNITIGGKFDGTIIAQEEVIILSTGSCTGKVKCKRITIEQGAILNADIKSMIDVVNNTYDDDEMEETLSAPVLELS